MSELEACPFCGESKKIVYDYYEISSPQELGIIVICNNCGASCKPDAWNTRPIEDALNKRITELETKLACLREERRWRKCSELPEDKQLCEVVDKYGDVSLWIYSGALKMIFLHKFKYWRPFEYPPGQNANHQNTK